MKLQKKKNQSSEGPASSPGDKSVQDSEQLQLNTIKAESTEECQLWAQSLPQKTIPKPLAPVKAQPSQHLDVKGAMKLGRTLK